MLIFLIFESWNQKVKIYETGESRYQMFYGIPFENLAIHNSNVEILTRKHLIIILSMSNMKLSRLPEKHEQICLPDNIKWNGGIVPKSFVNITSKTIQHRKSQFVKRVIISLSFNRHDPTIIYESPEKSSET